MATLIHEPPQSMTTRPAPRRRPRVGLAVTGVVLSLGLALLLIAHAWIPDVGGVALVIESGLPWLGLAIPVLLVVALVSRSKGAIAAALVPLVAWGVMFVPALLPLTPAAASASTLTVASQNVEADSGTAAESATALAATGAQVIALQEMDDAARSSVDDVLSDAYPYSYGIGTVGIWSTYPIENAQMLDLGLGWQRGIAADLSTPVGLVSIYVIHAASARPDDHADRDTMLANLADYAGRDPNSRLIMMGDFNAGSSDRSLADLTSQLTEANQSGGGLGFTWPSTFPLTRLDHVLTRGVDATSSTTLRAGASDHLALVTTLSL
jgi:vancomycin resistance protein VanJ